MAGASYARARLLASFGAQSSAVRLQRAHQARPVSHQCAIGVFLAGHAERTNPMDWFPDRRTAKEHQPSAIARCCQIERAITIGQHNFARIGRCCGGHELTLMHDSQIGRLIMAIPVEPGKGGKPYVQQGYRAGGCDGADPVPKATCQHSDPAAIGTANDRDVTGFQMMHHRLVVFALHGVVQKDLKSLDWLVGCGDFLMENARQSLL